MTLGDYISQLASMMQTQFAISENDTGIMTQVVNDARTDVYNGICEIAPFKSMRRKDGANPVTFATSDRLNRIDTVMVDPGGGNPLIPANKLAQEELYMYQYNSLTNPTSTKPAWKQEGLVVTVLPSGGNLKILYLETPPLLSAMSDPENFIPYEATRLVLQRAAVILLQKQGMLQSMDMVNADYAGMLKRFGEEWYDSQINVRKNFSTKTTIR